MKLTFKESAQVFCAHNVVIAARKKEIRCTNREDGAACHTVTDDPESMCAGCRKRVTEKEEYFREVKMRASAKRTMMRLFAKKSR